MKEEEEEEEDGNRSPPSGNAIAKPRMIRSASNPSMAIDQYGRVSRMERKERVRISRNGRLAIYIVEIEVGDSHHRFLPPMHTVECKFRETSFLSLPRVRLPNTDGGEGARTGPWTGRDPDCTFYNLKKKIVNQIICDFSYQRTAVADLLPLTVSLVNNNNSFRILKLINFKSIYKDIKKISLYLKCHSIFTSFCVDKYI